MSPFGATRGSRLPATADSVGLFGGFGSVPFVCLILSARRRYQSDVLFGFGRPKAVLAKTDRQVLQERLKGFVMTKPMLAKSERHSRQVR